MDRSNNFTNIKKIIENIFSENKNLPDINIILLKKKWKSAVGEQLFSHTEPYRIHNKQLFIYCNHQGWINILQFYKNDIINNIKNILESDKVNDIKFLFKKN